MGPCANFLVSGHDGEAVIFSSGDANVVRSSNCARPRAQSRRTFDKSKPAPRGSLRAGLVRVYLVGAQFLTRLRVACRRSRAERRAIPRDRWVTPSILLFINKYIRSRESKPCILRPRVSTDSTVA